MAMPSCLEIVATAGAIGGLAHLLHGGNEQADQDRDTAITASNSINENPLGGHFFADS